MLRKLENQNKQVKEMKKKIFPLVNIEDIPFEVQEEMVCQERGIPYHIWQQYTQEVRGKIIASSIIKSRISTIEMFYRETENAKKQNTGDKSKKGNKQ